MFALIYTLISYCKKTIYINLKTFPPGFLSALYMNVYFSQYVTKASIYSDGRMLINSNTGDTKSDGQDIKTKK